MVMHEIDQAHKSHLSHMCATAADRDQTIVEDVAEKRAMRVSRLASVGQPRISSI
jgi:hypothetical protein